MNPKTDEEIDNYEPPTEYPAELMKNGQRGRYFSAYRDALRTRLLDPELAEAFKDNDAVNAALREYLALKQRIA